MIRTLLIVIAILFSRSVYAADYPTPTEGDYKINNFKFRSGTTMPELRIHYRTLGKPERDSTGMVKNAVLIMHGTTGSGQQFIRPEFAGELFRKDGLLDAEKFYIILPDAIGHGQSSKPSDGLRARISELRLPGYGRGRLPAADRRA